MIAFGPTWCTIYPGYHNRISQVSAFISDQWTQLTNLNAIELRLSGANAHSSLGVGVKQHGPRWRTYLKVHHHYPHKPILFVLKAAVNSLNDTIIEQCLVPSRLVFGILPKFPILNKAPTNQKDIIYAIITAQAEMNSIVSECRFYIPPPTISNFELGEALLVYNEDKNG